MFSRNSVFQQYCYTMFDKSKQSTQRSCSPNTQQLFHNGNKAGTMLFYSRSLFSDTRIKEYVNHYIQQSRCLVQSKRIFCSIYCDLRDTSGSLYHNPVLLQIHSSLKYSDEPENSQDFVQDNSRITDLQKQRKYDSNIFLNI